MIPKYFCECEENCSIDLWLVVNWPVAQTECCVVWNLFGTCVVCVCVCVCEHVCVCVCVCVYVCVGIHTCIFCVIRESFVITVQSSGQLR